MFQEIPLPLNIKHNIEEVTIPKVPQALRTALHMAASSVFFLNTYAAYYKHQYGNDVIPELTAGIVGGSVAFGLDILNNAEAASPLKQTLRDYLGRFNLKNQGAAILDFDPDFRTEHEDIAQNVKYLGEIFWGNKIYEP